MSNDLRVVLENAEKRTTEVRREYVLAVQENTIAEAKMHRQQFEDMLVAGACHESSM